ncbi:MAG TPA: hypothetical protein VJJ22_01120 [Candidatus Paceibacterota bacterium]
MSKEKFDGPHYEHMPAEDLALIARMNHIAQEEQRVREDRNLELDRSWFVGERVSYPDYDSKLKSKVWTLKSLMKK